MSFDAEIPMTGKDAENNAEFPSEALVQLIHTQQGHMSVRQRIEGGRSLLARSMWSRRPRRWSMREMGPVLAVAVVVIGLVISARGRRATSALSVAVDGGHLDREGFVQAETPRPARLRFSDGTEVLLDRDTRASVRSLDSHGARVSLAEGTAHVDVLHKPGTSWLFDAGPFLVHVTGTSFTLAWKAADQQLDLKMERGTVEVSGPLSDGSILLRSGQHLIVRVRQRETLIRDVEDEAAPQRPAPEARAAEGGEQEAGTPAMTAVTSAATGAGAPLHASRRIENVDWSAELPKGGFEAIVEEAERWGVEATLNKASSENLAALADAARYGRRDDVARRALLAQRRRFPGASAARDASFLLGRLEESQHDVAGAIEWFDRYLDESPSGTYASEALGRKMILVRALYGDARARAVAASYLSRFPQGVYAARAQALARAP